MMLVGPNLSRQAIGDSKQDECCLFPWPAVYAGTRAFQQRKGGREKREREMIIFSVVFQV